MAPTTAGIKRKKPPTFQHLPEQRAKKLKRDWVIKHKIRSKWKAEKRREGIVIERDARTFASKVGEDDNVTGSKPRSNSGELDDSNDEEVETHDTQAPTPISARSQTKSDATGKKETVKPSLRELQRQAYSRESLHHCKSDPMHRRRGREGNAKRVGKGGIGRGGSNGSRDGGIDRGGSGRGRGRGGGQPDMRLRMAAMLEKVKQSVAVDR